MLVTENISECFVTGEIKPNIFDWLNHLQGGFTNNCIVVVFTLEPK